MSSASVSKYMTEQDPEIRCVFWPAKFVRIKVFAYVTGYSVEAIETKIKRGIWIEGKEYRRAPDGNLCIDMEGYHRWVEGRQDP